MYIHFKKAIDLGQHYSLPRQGGCNGAGKEAMRNAHKIVVRNSGGKERSW
jgi:hypothetical protein